MDLRRAGIELVSLFAAVDRGLFFGSVLVIVVGHLDSPVSSDIKAAIVSIVGASGARKFWPLLIRLLREHDGQNFKMDIALTNAILKLAKNVDAAEIFDILKSKVKIEQVAVLLLFFKKRRNRSDEIRRMIEVLKNYPEYEREINSWRPAKDVSRKKVL